MDEFLKMDVFFVVTTVAVVVLTILLTIIFLRVIRILQNIERISLMVEAESKELREDIAQVRAKVKAEGLRLSHMFDFLGAGKKRKRTPKSES